jgi:hypothetical protein
VCASVIHSDASSVSTMNLGSLVNVGRLEEIINSLIIKIDAQDVQVCVV